MKKSVVAAQTSPKIDVSLLHSGIKEYEAQSELVQEQIKQLDANYATQREIGINSLNQLAGAIQALQKLVAITQPQASAAPNEDGAGQEE